MNYYTIGNLIINLCVFGFLSFLCLYPYVHNKIEVGSTICTFLGYTTNHQGYLCLDTKIDNTITSRNVVFTRIEFSFLSYDGVNAYVLSKIHVPS